MIAIVIAAMMVVRMMRIVMIFFRVGMVFDYCGGLG